MSLGQNLKVYLHTWVYRNTKNTKPQTMLELLEKMFSIINKKQMKQRELCLRSSKILVVLYEAFKHFKFAQRIKTNLSIQIDWLSA